MPSFIFAKLKEKLVIIENKLGGSEEAPEDCEDKLGWHLDYIESLIKGGSSGSTKLYRHTITAEDLFEFAGNVTITIIDNNSTEITSENLNARILASIKASATNGAYLFGILLTSDWCIGSDVQSGEVYTWDDILFTNLSADTVTPL